MQGLLLDILGYDTKTTLLLILNIIIMESLLSIDNAAVLASMVMDLPKEQRKKALYYGMLGAIGFRVICLLLVSFLLKIWWIEPLGGLYLIYLAVNYFLTQKHKQEQFPADEVEVKGLKRFLRTLLSPFAATVLMIQIMDLAFSVDNILAVVAFSKDYNLIITGVIIGIITMRFVANWFVKLMEKYPFLETTAFVVIFILGFKLALAFVTHPFPNMPVLKYLGSGGNVDKHIKEKVDMYFSLLTILIFITPIVYNRYFVKVKP